mmetsp:Transcript_18353/g.52420  ORF Transcript_18353/g.52420 Transcript_18353/m.52420 type:complete len:289 (-) Transcript_18353:967-1833(-)
MRFLLAAVTIAIFIRIGVLELLSGNGLVNVGVLPHEEDVPDVHDEQDDGLPHLDLVGGDDAREDAQNGEADGVVGGVAEQGPPGELKGLLGHEGARRDDEEDVEDGGPNDGTEANLGFAEGSEQAGEQLRRGSAGSHQRRTGDVHAQVHAARGRHLLQGRHEEFVADDGQRQEHVEDADAVEDREPLRIGLFDVGAQVLRLEAAVPVHGGVLGRHHEAVVHVVHGVGSHQGDEGQRLADRADVVLLLLALRCGELGQHRDEPRVAAGDVIMRRQGRCGRRLLRLRRAR